jgi:hypothetical protein
MLIHNSNPIYKKTLCKSPLFCEKVKTNKISILIFKKLPSFLQMNYFSYQNDDDDDDDDNTILIAKTVHSPLRGKNIQNLLFFCFSCEIDVLVGCPLFIK